MATLDGGAVSNLKGTMSQLKEQMLHQLEQSVNKYRTQRQDLEEQLEEVRTLEDEARGMMQLLKTGKTVTKTKSGRGFTSPEDYLEAAMTLQADGTPITRHTLSELTGSSAAAATQKLSQWLTEGITEVTKPRGPGVNVTEYGLVDNE